MIKVGFICVHNSCRSQIAEALGKKIAFDTFIDFAFNSGVLSGTEADRYKSEMWDILIHLSKVQNEEQAE